MKKIKLYKHFLESVNQQNVELSLSTLVDEYGFITDYQNSEMIPNFETLKQNSLFYTNPKFEFTESFYEELKRINRRCNAEDSKVFIYTFSTSSPKIDGHQVSKLDDFISDNSNLYYIYSGDELYLLEDVLPQLVRYIGKICLMTIVVLVDPSLENKNI